MLVYTIRTVTIVPTQANDKDVMLITSRSMLQTTPIHGALKSGQQNSTHICESACHARSRAGKRSTHGSWSLIVDLDSSCGKVACQEEWSSPAGRPLKFVRFCGITATYSPVPAVTARFNKKLVRR